jgi:hypothetical protein
MAMYLTCPDPSFYPMLSTSLANSRFDIYLKFIDFGDVNHDVPLYGALVRGSTRYSPYFANLAGRAYKLGHRFSTGEV